MGFFAEFVNVNYHVDHQHPFAIGVGSTLLAVTMPESWLSYGERFAFAIFTAVMSSIVSRVFTHFTLPKRPK
jgi:hypothetical protein